MTQSRFSRKALALVFLAACQGPPAWETQSSLDLADTAFATDFREGTGGGNTGTPESPSGAGTDGTSDVDDGPPHGVAELESIGADDPRIVTYRHRTNAIPLQCRTKVLFSVRVPLAGRARSPWRACGSTIRTRRERGTSGPRPFTWAATKRTGNRTSPSATTSARETGRSSGRTSASAPSPSTTPPCPSPAGSDRIGSDRPRALMEASGFARDRSSK